MTTWKEEDVLAVLPVEVKPYGNGAHVVIPKKYLGRKVTVIVKNK